MKEERHKVRQRSSSVSILIEAFVNGQEGVTSGGGMFLRPQEIFSQVEKLRQATRSQAQDSGTLYGGQKDSKRA